MAIAGVLVVRMGRGPAPSLLIGIGNPLRGDDGVGPWLVETWARRRAWRAAAAGAAPAEAAAQPVGRGGGEAVVRLAGLRIRLVDQLLPELAEELAAVRRVLFVDAWPDAPAGEPSASGASGSRLMEGEPPGRGLRSSGPRLLAIEIGRAHV